MPRRPTNYPPPKPVRPTDPLDAFVFDFGFPGTPAGDRMREGLERLASRLLVHAAEKEMNR